MRDYPQRVRDNILPLSVGSTLPEAFEEWSFTEATLDHEAATEVCELCEHEQLRYRFEIRNTLTQKTLWVGSQCILKFNLSVFEQRCRLSPVESKKKLDRLMQQMRLDSCVRALERLVDSEESDILNKALVYYRRNKFLTPKFAFVVLWQLQKHHIDHSPTFFKVSLKKDWHKKDLKEMVLSRVHVIWPALSTSQREIAVRLGHVPPNCPLPKH